MLTIYQFYTCVDFPERSSPSTTMKAPRRAIAQKVPRAQPGPAEIPAEMGPVIYYFFLWVLITPQE